jgi:hypothetical protein
MAWGSYRAGQVLNERRAKLGNVLDKILAVGPPALRELKFLMWPAGLTHGANRWPMRQRYHAYGSSSSSLWRCE